MRTIKGNFNGDLRRPGILHGMGKNFLIVVPRVFLFYRPIVHVLTLRLYFCRYLCFMQSPQTELTERETAQAWAKIAIVGQC